MRRLQQILAAATVLWLLTSLVGADPAKRVAIVTPLSENVQLDGVVLKSPKIAGEGQKLTLGKDCKARLQLLGSPKETTVKGQADYVISRAKLEKDAKVLSRGSITVESEIGDVARAAAGSARALPGRIGKVPKDVKGYEPIGFTLELPPKRTSWGYQITIPTPIEASPENSIELILTDLDTEEQFPFTLDQPTTSLDFPDDPGLLKVGHRYEIQAKRGGIGYARCFRLMTAEEQSAADEVAGLLRVDALQSGDIAMLLRLANFYRNTDDAAKAAEVLKEVVNNPGYAELNIDTRESIKTVLNATLNSLDQRNYVAVK